LTAFAPNPDRFNPSKTDSSKAVRLYFAATHISFGRELWTTPGRNAIIERIEINPGTADSAPSYLTVAKVRQRGRLINVLYFAADRLGFGRELWRTNLRGQAAGIVMDIRGGAEGSNPFNLTKVSPRNPDRADTVFLGADNGFFGAELWRSNGQFAGTFLIEDINPGGPDSHSLEESATTLMAEFKHRLYFAADDGRVGRELWRSGRARGSATLVRDINPGVNSSNPTAQEHPLPKLRNLIFRRRRPDNVFVDHLLFFGADNGTMGGEPWRTSGTFGGTVILRDIRVGPDSSLIQNELVGIVFPQRPPTPPERLQPNRRQVLHFAADDGFFGRELWRSDGNINNPLFNTRRDETDINPGPPSSTPSFFEISPGGVFFAADKDFLGRELWRVNPIP
jgi:ELWxxDGT repeat protein